jgi:perosamine synthetase
MLIPHSKPNLDNDDIKAVTKVLSSGNIAQGEKVKEFEQKISGFIGTKYGIAVSSGTTAIHLALASLGVKPEDEIIIPSYVCASLYMAILHAGAKPKIVDIVPDSFNTCIESVRKEITSKTKAIIVPHMFGNPADIDEILELGIPTIEDCAQALGAEYKKQKVGSYGQISICSFYATKIITTGEGGMILTNDKDIYNKIVDCREYDKESVDKVRYNYKMTDFQAALGISQLRKLDSFIDRRRAIANIYNKNFSESSVTLPNNDENRRPIYYRYVIMHDKMHEIQKAAKNKGIMCERPVRMPLHKNNPSLICPNSDLVYERALSIPIYPSLTESELEFILKNMKEIFKK